MSLHELDRGDHPYDRQISVTEEGKGRRIANLLQQWMRKNDRVLPKDAKFLGLGAGLGSPELAMAEELGIKDNRVVLIDKQEDPATKITLMHPNIQYRVSGFFHFLENPTDNNFSVVSAIGMEHVFNKQKTLEKFVQTIPNVLSPQAFVAIYPYVGENYDNLWKLHGFDCVYRSDSRYAPLVYTYAPE